MPRWCGWPRDPDTCVAATHGSPAAPPAQRQRHRSGSPVAKCAGARPVAPEHDRGPAGLSQGLARGLGRPPAMGSSPWWVIESSAPAPSTSVTRWVSQRLRASPGVVPRRRSATSSTPACTGQGDGTEMVRAMLEIAFDDVGLHRVTGSCFADNTGSWRVMEKAGMRCEQYGVQDSWHAEHGWVDGCTYAICARSGRVRRGSAWPPAGGPEGQPRSDRHSRTARAPNGANACPRGA